MMELDESGLGHIHHAAKKGYFKSVEKFIKTMEVMLEFETQDGLNETPLLVAAHIGVSNVDTIEVLVNLGANMKAVNTKGHGLVEIACMEEHTELLDYFIRKDYPDVPVWKNILKLCSSTSEEESQKAGTCLSILSRPDDNGAITSYWKIIYDHDAIPVLVKVIKSEIGDSAKAPAIQCLINLLTEVQVKNQLVSCAAIDLFIKHLKSTTPRIIQLVATALSILCTIKTYAEQATNQGAIQALVNVLKNSKDTEVLVEVVNAIGVICDSNATRQSTLHGTGDGIQCLCTLVKETTDPNLLLALTKCISRIVRRHEVNQRAIVDGDAVQSIIALCNIKNKGIQLSAVEAIHMLVEGNSYTQKSLIKEGAINPLIILLRRSKNQTVQEKTASALWALAGSSNEDRRAMASRMQVKLLVDFLGSLSEILKYIGSEGIGVLAQGAHNSQNEIAEANGVFPIVRLLKEEKEYLVLSAIRTIRHICLSIGYIPHKHNQDTVAQARGIKYLKALMILSKSELLQAEAALALASISLNNPVNMEKLWTDSENLPFSYIRVLKLLYSADSVVRLLAGACLATFAYNNMAQQRMIAADGGVRFSCFLDFLQSDDEYFRCSAAFQVVVLSRVIPDEEQAVISAAGIKLIVDILRDSQSTITQALAADCVARLAHTRAGIPEAFVAVNTVDRLCDLMLSENTQVRGCTAIALAFLSYNHKAERQLLNRSRIDPYIKECLSYYADKSMISQRFLQEWQHYVRIGLPPISQGRPVLVSQDYTDHFIQESDSKPVDIHADTENKLNNNEERRPGSKMSRYDASSIKSKRSVSSQLVAVE